MYLFNQARRALPSSARRELATSDPHDWRLPTAYAASKPGGKQTLVPSPDIIVNAFIPIEPRDGDLQTALAYPDVSHAAVHLALLECFRHLRLSAAEQFDIEIHKPPEYQEKQPDEAPAATTRLTESQRWDLLVRLAIDRFAAWWANIDSVLNHASSYAHRAGSRVPVQLTRDYLPPLDVLLVWYAFMLNGDAYSAMCYEREQQCPRISLLCFPWPAIRDAIDMHTMRYTISPAAQKLFSTLSDQEADILRYLQSPPAFTDPDAVPLGVDLFAEVNEVQRFVDEAHDLLWIRSPALQGTLTRASAEYTNFQLEGEAASVLADGDESQVPFRIKLLWWTHRLFPRQYKFFLREIGRGEEKYHHRYSTKQGIPFDEEGQDSSVTSQDCCRCWVCERIRDDAPTFSRPLDLPSPDSPPTSGSSSPPPPEVPKYLKPLSKLSLDQFREILDDLGFFYAVESARTEGKALPTRPPTAAEKEAEKAAKKIQDEIGYRTGLYEFSKVMP